MQKVVCKYKYVSFLDKSQLIIDDYKCGWKNLMKNDQSYKYYLNLNQKQYDKGFKDGYRDGFKDGYRDGFREGKADSKMTYSAFIKKTVGKSDYDRGYEKGYSYCFPKGYEAGPKVKK